MHRVLQGKVIVFTGAMSERRGDMEVNAQLLGAIVNPRVKAGTDWLVTGKRVGRVKTEAAAKYGVKTMTEAEYRHEVQRLTWNAEHGEDDQSTPEPDEPHEPKRTFTEPAWLDSVREKGGVPF